MENLKNYVESVIRRDWPQGEINLDVLCWRLTTGRFSLCDSAQLRVAVKQLIDEGRLKYELKSHTVGPAAGMYASLFLNQGAQ